MGKCKYCQGEFSETVYPIHFQYCKEEFEKVIQENKNKTEKTEKKAREKKGGKIEKV